MSGSEGTDRLLRRQAREEDPTREGWTARLRARWRVAAEAKRVRLERWLRLGALLDWPPAREILGEFTEPPEVAAVGRYGREPSLRAARALAVAVVSQWGRGETGELAERVLAGYELPGPERRALAEQATLLGLRERPPAGAQRTGEISPSGRAAALAGRALGLSLAEPSQIEAEFRGCLELAAGLLSPSEMVDVAREALVPLLSEELDRS
ncbi:MAG: hypothetical protein JKY65_04505 [Planctomycetes bacterium]|nr:hypothetical protein [Planctomycetota bacterium]